MRFPYGIADFQAIINEGYFYVDRTDRIPLIEEAGKQLLFLRPRRFGKSLWLSTLENYYDLARAADFEQLFGGLKIGQNPTPLHNQYFVLKLNFSVIDPKGDAEAIAASLHRHLNNAIEAFAVRYREALNAPIECHPTDSLSSLGRLLTAISTTPYKLYLLIDEYDNFANEVMISPLHGTNRYQTLVEGEGTIKTLFKAIKAGAEGRGIDRVFLTGVSPVVLSDITSGYNVAKDLTHLDEYHDLCGFAHEELSALLTAVAAARSLPDERAAEILDLLRWFYNGYRFGEGENPQIYNPTLALYSLPNGDPLIFNELISNFFVTTFVEPDRKIPNVRSTIMKAEWMVDARKIPDEVMNHLRRIAVRAVEEKQYSPELVADFLGVSRSCIYDWLRRYHAQGEGALDTQKAPGGPVVMTPEMDQWLKETILNSTPLDHGYDTVLWTLAILVELLKKQFKTWVSDSTVALHLHQMKLSCQKPCYRARGRDPVKVATFVNNKFPMIQMVAKKLGADILFEDEAGIAIMTRSGRTWGEVDSPPPVTVSDQRGGYNVLSMITAQGELVYELEERTINSERYIEFLRMVLANRAHPIIVIADNASFHRSKEVRLFVRLNRKKIRMFFLPPHAPELNPDEQVWNEVKHRQLGKQPIKNKPDLHQRIQSALALLKRQAEKIQSFFHLPDTRYAALQASAL